MSDVLKISVLGVDNANTPDQVVAAPQVSVFLDEVPLATTIRVVGIGRSRISNLVQGPRHA